MKISTQFVKKHFHIFAQKLNQLIQSRLPSQKTLTWYRINSDYMNNIRKGDSNFLHLEREEKKRIKLPAWFLR